MGNGKDDDFTGFKTRAYNDSQDTILRSEHVELSTSNEKKEDTKNSK